MEYDVRLASHATAWGTICLFGPYLVRQNDCTLWSTVCVVVVLLSVMSIWWAVYVCVVLFMFGKIWLSKLYVIIITNNWPTRSPLFGNRSDHNVYNMHALSVHYIQWILLPYATVHRFHGSWNQGKPHCGYLQSGTSIAIAPLDLLYRYTYKQWTRSLYIMYTKCMHVVYIVVRSVAK